MLVFFPLLQTGL